MRIAADGDCAVGIGLDLPARIFPTTCAAGVAELVQLVGTGELSSALAISAHRHRCRGFLLRRKEVVEQCRLHHVPEAGGLMLAGHKKADAALRYQRQLGAKPLDVASVLE